MTPSLPISTATPREKEENGGKLGKITKIAFERYEKVVYLKSLIEQICN